MKEDLPGPILPGLFQTFEHAAPEPSRAGSADELPTASTARGGLGRDV